jgi:hypothetical protein
VGGNGSGNNGGMKKAIQTGLTAALPVVLEKMNVSDIDVNKITNQLQKLKGKVQDLDIEDITHQLQETIEKTTKTRVPGFNSHYRQDVESYIQNSLPWHFNRITIKDEFRDVIYDPQADAATMRRLLLLQSRLDSLCSTPRELDTSTEAPVVYAAFVQVGRGKRVTGLQYDAKTRVGFAPIGRSSGALSIRIVSLCPRL